MATKKKAFDVEEFTSPVKEFSKLLKETYINALDFSLSVAEENKKVFNDQLDYVLGAEKEYAKSVKGLYSEAPVKDLPFDLPFNKVDTKAFDEGVDRLIDYQKNALESVKGISDNVTTEGYIIAKKNVEKGFSLFDEALDSIKV